MRKAQRCLRKPHYKDFLWKKGGENKAIPKFYPSFCLLLVYAVLQEKSRPEEVVNSNNSTFPGRCSAESERLDALSCCPSSFLHSLPLLINHLLEQRFYIIPGGEKRKKRKKPPISPHKVDLSQNAVLLPTVFRSEHIFLWLLINWCTERASSFLTSPFLFCPSSM